MFNVGEYRRRVVANFTHTNSAQFFHPDNIEANAIRELVSPVLVSLHCMHWSLLLSVILTVLYQSLLCPPRRGALSDAAICSSVYLSVLGQLGMQHLGQATRALRTVGMHTDVDPP